MPWVTPHARYSRGRDAAVEEDPLQRTEQGVEREESVRKIEALPDPPTEQNAADDLHAIGEPAPQSQLIALQRPPSGSILRRLEALGHVLGPCVVQNPSRLAAGGLQLHGSGERVGVHELQLLREPESGGHLRKDGVLTCLIGQDASLLCGEAVPQGSNVGQRLEAEPSVEGAVNTEIEKAADKRQNAQCFLTKMHLLIQLQICIGQRFAGHVRIAKEPPVQIDLEIVAMRAIG